MKKTCEKCGKTLKSIEFDISEKPIKRKNGILVYSLDSVCRTCKLLEHFHGEN
ncbi:MAG: hypothetical protein ACTSQG_09065 [Promethearchaeota archaeon]